MLARPNAFSEQHITTYYISESLKSTNNGGCRRPRKRFEDPMSHRIIEKRRRDRMNNCLADLSRLIPAEYLKKGRGRIEKTEIIEMAIKHMKFLQAQTCSQGCNKSENCEIKIDNGHRVVNDKQYQNGSRPEAEGSFQEQYKFGYQECLAETMHFLVELEGFFPTDALCVKLMGHLQKYYEKVAKGDKIVYRSPLENVSLPNTYEPKVNGFHASSINETNELNGRNSIISPAHYDDNSQNENVNGNSQLREMLVKPHLNPLYTPKVRPNIIRHSSPEPLSSPTDSINVDAHSSNGSLFKFKNYIKERFSAEHSSGTSSTESSSPTSVVACGHKRRAEYMTIDQPPSPDAKPIDDHYPIVSRPVPIFALHAKGSFYIPLTVDSHLLTPFVTELNSDYSHGFSPSMVLHPVTISVNFNRPSVSPNDIECKPLLPPMITNRIQNTPLLMVPECR